ncbi:hypothetical protein [Actinophytocola algeriensis]|uniref:Uncharacterized protein n=1 Tax=Actinophytocola algeriensis TaxID=1768010 RepID=A0A7W7VIN4_9PSEU|nr:hypothetical protein [Actinophytocola algeriensis]MBB4911459.1 hypothetical protein [Actinophytocola algeriensis]MBE1479398.1 hypothetical protein [Actinophytocola algeriensis]
MRIRTDDEVYRVDAVWLGPPRATMPWRARYVAWGVGVFVFLIVLTVERRLGIDLFWSIAWGIVVTILLTRMITSKISHERPLSAVSAMWLRELTAPREATAGEGGAVSATRVRVSTVRPTKQAKQTRPKQRKQQEQRQQRQKSKAERNRARAERARAKSRQRNQQRNRPGRQETKRGRGGGVRTPRQARS